MHVARIMLLNYGPFRGAHVVDLEPKAYAITARHDEAPERSNWSGKTWLANAVRHALYGEHLADTEDGWITRGEDKGGVSVRVLHTQGWWFEVFRERVRGSATSVTIKHSAGGNAKGAAEVQSQVDRIVGVSLKDSDATWFVQQKAMSRHVTSDPGARMDVAREWFRLGRLQACADNVARRLAAEGDKARALRERVSGVAAEVEALKLAAPVLDAAAMEVEREKLAGRTARMEQERDGMSEWVRRSNHGAKWEETVKEGRRLKEQACSVKAAQEAEEVARERHGEAKEQLRDTNREVARLASLSRGQFDGACPVSTGFKCPARDQINAGAEQNRVAHEVAKEKLDEHLRDADLKRGVHERALRLLGDSQRAEEQIARLRTLAREQAEHARWAEANKPSSSPDGLDGDLRQARSALFEVEAKIKLVKHTEARMAALAAESDRCVQELKAVEGRCDVLRAAAAVFGRHGAQRRVAERALGEIEAEANARLVESGAELSLSVRWARASAGKDLAAACDSCGQAFPSSQRVKLCERCGVQRGPKLIQRLDVVPSDRSGAADDLAGVMYQLAACTWLRRDRSSDWSVVVLDEPLSAMDPAVRRGLTGCLARLVGPGGACEQMLLISHTPDVGMLPGRIVVSVAADGSRAITVA